MIPRVRRTPLAVLALALAFGAAGCGAEADRAGTSGGAQDSAQGRGADAQRPAAVRFSTCMRDHGVDDFPDPDAAGELTVDAVLNGTGLDPESPTWTAALDACEDLQPAGFTGHQRTVAQQAAALKFAQCMREHDVPDFPDPGIDDPLVDTTKIGDGDVDMAALNAAMQTCGAIYGDQLGVKAP